jgi:hypothetical protein
MGIPLLRALSVFASSWLVMMAKSKTLWGGSMTGGWRKPSQCASGECLEMTVQNGEVLLRSSRAPDDVLSLTPAEWRILVRAIRAGELEPDAD